MDLKSCRVLVTPTSYGKTDPRLFTELESLVGEVVYNTTGKPVSASELARLLPGMDGYIAGLDEINGEALKAADRLKIVARYGVGLDNVDLDVARKKGIAVTCTPGANSASVAELTVALILSLGRKVPEAVAATRAGGWPRWAGISLDGKNVGLLGFGSIGKQVARRLAGFDCRILAYGPMPDHPFAQAHGVELMLRDDVLAAADFLSLHLPLVPETRGLVNDAFLRTVKEGAFLINTARGELIDDDALARSIQSGHLQGAALDVFSKEPPDADSPLLKLPQVLVTPHCASHTDGAMSAMGWMALRDCLAVLRGESPKYPVV